MPRSLNRWVIVLWAAAVLLSLAALRSYPLPTCDETSYSSAALALTEPGSASPLAFSQGMPGAQGRFAVLSFGRKLTTYNLALAAQLSLLGASLHSARLFAWFGWLIAGALCFQLGRRLFSLEAGWVAAALFVTSAKAYMTGHVARPDIWVTAATLAAALMAWQVIAAPGRLPWWKIVATGVILIWPGEIHMSGFPFSAGIAAAVLAEAGIRQRRWRDILLFGGGALLGAGMWLLMLALSGVDAAEIANLGRYAAPFSSAPAPGSAPAPDRWLRNLRTLPGWFALVFWTGGGPLAPVEAAFALLGIACGLRNGGRQSRTLILAGLVSLAVFGVAHRVRWVQYGALWSPLWYLLGTGALLQIARRWNSARLKAALSVGLVALVAAQAAGMGWLALRHRTPAYPIMGAAIRDLIPPGRSVAADPIWWWHLTDHPFLSDEYFLYMTGTDRQDVQAFLGIDVPLATGDAARRIFVRLHPDYVILDRAVGCLSSQDSRHAALLQLAESRCEQVATIHSPSPGTPFEFSSLGQTNVVYLCP